MDRAALYQLRTRLIDAPGGRPRPRYLTRGEAIQLLSALLADPVGDTLEDLAKSRAAAAAGYGRMGKLSPTATARLFAEARKAERGSL